MLDIKPILTIDREGRIQRADRFVPVQADQRVLALLDVVLTRARSPRLASRTPRAPEAAERLKVCVDSGVSVRRSSVSAGHRVLVDARVCWRVAVFYQVEDAGAGSDG